MNWDESTWDSGTWDSPSAPVLPPLFVKKRKTKYKTMASNPTPEDDDVLLALAEDLADGCHDLEVALGILRYKETVIRAAITDLNASGLALANATTLQAAKRGLLQEKDEAGKGVIGNVRRRLSKLYGERFNSNWQAAGFPDGSTQVPLTQDKRFTLLGKLKLFFHDTPAAESADMEATEAICAAAHTAVSDARLALNTAETAQSNALKARNDSIKMLRKCVRGLITELGDLMPDDDTRYETFGLNIPANPSAPEGIASITVTAAGGGDIHAAWPYATRMAGTRLLTKRTTGAEIDADFINAGTTAGLEKTLVDFVPGVVVQVKAIPYNDGGDGPESPAASVTVT